MGEVQSSIPPSSPLFLSSSLPISSSLSSSLLPSSTFFQSNSSLLPTSSSSFRPSCSSFHPNSLLPSSSSLLPPSSNSLLTFQIHWSASEKFQIQVPRSSKTKFLLNLVRKTAKERKLEGLKGQIGLEPIEYHPFLEFLLSSPEQLLENLGDGGEGWEVKVIRTEGKSVGKVRGCDFKGGRELGRKEGTIIRLVRHFPSLRLFTLKQTPKVLLSDSPATYQEVLREKEILSKLDFPFIPKLFCCFESELHLNMVLEYVPFCELSKILKAFGKLKEDVAKFVFAQLVLTMEYLHFNKVLYRNLDPSSLLLLPDGYLLLSPSSFSSSKLLPPSSLTSSFCTSSPYIAPEIFNNFGHSFESDFFGLGALLFELVSGEPPFEGVGIEERNSLRSENCGRWPEGVSGELKNLLLALLNKNPRERIHDFSLLKSSPWLMDVEWNQILLKNRLSPLFMPTPPRSVKERGALLEKDGFSFEREKPFKEIYKKFYYVSRDFEEIAGANASTALTEVKNRNPSAVSAQTTAFMIEKNFITIHKPKSARKIDQVKTVEVKLNENLIKRTLSPSPFSNKIKGSAINTSGPPSSSCLHPPPIIKAGKKTLKNNLNGLSYRGAPKTFFEMKNQINSKEKNLKLSARKEGGERKKEEEGRKEEEGKRKEEEKRGRRNEGRKRVEEDERRGGEFAMMTVWKDGLEGEEFLFRTK